MRLIGENNESSFQQVNRVCFSLYSLNSYIQLMLEMNASMVKLMNSQEEMRAQIEVLQRAMRNHFSNSNSNNSPKFQQQKVKSKSSINFLDGFECNFSLLNEKQINRYTKNSFQLFLPNCTRIPGVQLKNIDVCDQFQIEQMYRDQKMEHRFF